MEWIRRLFRRDDDGAVRQELAKLEQKRSVMGGREYAKRKREVLAPLPPAARLKVREEQDEGMDRWIADHLPSEPERVDETACRAALTLTRGFVPRDIRETTLAILEKTLPTPLAQRVWHKKSLWLCRMHPDDIQRLHIADLWSRYDNQGLDIVEMRSTWASLPTFVDAKKDEWKQNFLVKLLELETKQAEGRLAPQEARHAAYDDADPNGYFYDQLSPLRADVDAAASPSPASPRDWEALPPRRLVSTRLRANC